MPEGKLPVAVENIGTLLLFGTVHEVARVPIDAACVLKRPGSADSIWIDIAYPVNKCPELWRLAFPGVPVPPALEVRPLMDPMEAARRGSRLVRLGQVDPSAGKFDADGHYVLTGVQH